MKYQIIAILLLCVLLIFVVLPVGHSLDVVNVHFTQVVGAVAVASLALLLWRRKVFSCSAIDVVMLLWFVYVAVRAYLQPIYPTASFFLQALTMLSLYFALRLLFSAVRFDERFIVIALVLCGLYEAGLGIWQFILGYSRHGLFPMTGSFLNPGPYSLILSIAIVLCIRLKRGWWVALFLGFVLVVTWSRAAMIAAAVCIGIAYWQRWRRWRWWVLSGFLLVLVALYFVKHGSADGRSIIYIVSSLCIAREPIFGAGIGSFCHSYAEEFSRFSIEWPYFNFQSADVVTNAFNILLQIGVEQGLVGVAFAIAIIILMFRRLRRIAPKLSLALLCMLIFSLFSYPFEFLPYQLIFIMIAAYAATSQTDYIEEYNPKITQRYVAPFLLAFCAFFTLMFTHNQIDRRVKAETEYLKIAGRHYVGFIDDYYDLLPMMRGNADFLFSFGKILALVGRYNDSNAMLRDGTLVSSDPMFYVVMGNNYRAMGYLHKAEASYRKAFSIMPNRIYPLYQLMMFYDEEGDIERAKLMARRVLDFNEKVTSRATKEMKHKAKTLLESPENANCVKK